MPCLDGIELRGSIPQGNSRVPQSHVVPHSPMGLTSPGNLTEHLTTVRGKCRSGLSRSGPVSPVRSPSLTSSASDAWALGLRAFTPVFHASRATQAVTTKARFCPVRPRLWSLGTRRHHADALKCAQRREKEASKVKVRGLKTPLERAEMHTEAFVQVAAVRCLVCRFAAASVSRSAPRRAGVPLCGSVHCP